MKPAIILLVSGLLTGVAFYLVWMNRASEKILGAIIPVAVAALAGIIMAVFVFGGEPAISIVFPSSFQYRLPSKMPPNLPWVLMNRRFSQALFAPAMLFKVHPEFFSDPADPGGQSLYHHLLQRAIIDWMGFTYSGTWQVEMLQFDLPIGREGRLDPSKVRLKSQKFYRQNRLKSYWRETNFSVFTPGYLHESRYPQARN